MNKDIKSILVHLPKLWQYDVMGSTAVLVSFSGGQSSALMGAYFCEKYPNRIGNNIHFFFGDTGQEMPETYKFIEQFETYYNIKVEKRKKDLIELIKKNWLSAKQNDALLHQQDKRTASKKNTLLNLVTNLMITQWLWG